MRNNILKLYRRMFAKTFKFLKIASYNKLQKLCQSKKNTSAKLHKKPNVNKRQRKIIN